MRVLLILLALRLVAPCNAALSALPTSAVFSNDVAAWTGLFYVAGVGDSIMEGFSTAVTPFVSKINGGPSGDTSMSVMQSLADYSGGLIYGTNIGWGQRTWATAWNTMIPYITNARPRVALFHFGVNDLFLSNVTWSSGIVTNMNNIRTQLNAFGIKMVVDEVFPSSNLSDAQAIQLRALNTNYMLWCQTSGASLFRTFSRMGTNRATTGYNDNLFPLYSDTGYGGTHLSNYGVAYWGQLMYSNLQSLAEVIVPDRRMVWNPGTNIGVLGGIPVRTTIYKNLVTEGADNTGVVDCHTLLQTTLAACPSNQVVYLPAGTYKLTDRVLWQSGSGTLRGDGMGSTILNCEISTAYNGVFDVGIAEGSKPVATLEIVKGAYIGSTNVEVSSTASITAGKLIRVEQQNLGWTHSITGETNNMQFLHYVTGKDATHVWFYPPLVFDLTEKPSIAVYANIFQRSGFEDLTINMTNSNCASAVFLQQAYNCWCKNVEVKNAKNKQLWLTSVINSEIRGCYTHDRRIAVGDSNAEGIDLYENCCWNLVEDNICIGAGFAMIQLGDFKGGCSGNVIGYNFSDRQVTGSGIAGASFGNNHGPHNMMNLWEGNVGQAFNADSYYGSSSHTTVFRNYLSGVWDKSLYQWPSALAVMKWNTYYNVVGNVLGSNGYSQVYQPTNVDYAGTDAVIYKIGYPNLGNSTFAGWGTNATNADWYDVNVQNTLIRHGNYDYVSNAIVWDAAIANHMLPDSYYLASKPTWFGSLAFPTIGSDVGIGMIPAQLRYYGGVQGTTNLVRTVRRKGVW